LFINGKLVETTTGLTNSAAGIGAPVIGSQGEDPSQRFSGAISNLRVIKGRAL
jgi:hypothetical protein